MFYIWFSKIKLPRDKNENNKGESTMSEQEEGNQQKKRSKCVLIILFLCIIMFITIFSFFFFRGEHHNTKDSPAKSVRIDDFYYAQDGEWVMETKIHLLKEKKYVSSVAELKKYLIYTAEPGEKVRISQAAGRWKHLEVIKDSKTIATGWVDAEDTKAERCSK